MANNYEAKDANDVTVEFESTDIGSGVQRPGVDIKTAAAGALVDIGNSTSTAAIITDTTGTVIGFLRGLVKLWITRLPAALGQAGMDASMSVAIANNQSAVPISGTVLNGGPAWTQIITPTSSADLSASPANLTPAPTSGQHTVIESVTVSAAVAMIVTLTEETTGLVIKVFNLTSGNLNAEWNPPNGVRLAQVNKKLQGQSDGAGQVDITVISHSTP
ncbi:MAG: hypothetical protein WBV94_09765 [Blastocatellia bacterium]